MRLRSAIFLWVTLAAIFPIVAMIFLTTWFSEREYRDRVNEEIFSHLSNVTSSLDRRLAYEREMLASLASSSVVKQFVPVLKASNEQKQLDDYQQRYNELKDFLQSLQNVLTDVGSIRLMNADGNSLMKMSFGEESGLDFEGLNPYRYAEAEIADKRFVEELELIPTEEIVYLLQQPNRGDFGARGEQPMLDAVVAFAEDGVHIDGYMSVNSTGRQLDRILELTPNPFKSSTAIIEINPEVPDRDGLILYDEGKSLIFSDAKDLANNIHDYLSPENLLLLQAGGTGYFDEASGNFRVYYTEYYPYPDQLVSWVLLSRVEITEITALFWGIRFLIGLVTAMALAISLWLAVVGSRRISAPIVYLAEQLKSFAKGRRFHNKRMPQKTYELDQLCRAFEYMANNLEKTEKERAAAEKMLYQSAKLVSIGEMAAGIGHELNNPLNNIISLAKLASRGVLDNEEVSEDLRSLIEEAHRASDIVCGLLDFSRQREPQYEQINAKSWLKKNIGLLERLAHDRGVKLTQTVEDGLVFDGDGNLLQQVLINLVLNAIQETPKGKSVDVSVSRHDDNNMRLVVVDEGPGISEDLMNKLFDPFFTTKPIGKGSGLGLSISLGIVQHHGGDLTLKNRSNGGVEARVILPFKRPKVIVENKNDE